MADANPTPKPLRVCQTCEWYALESGDERCVGHKPDESPFWSEGYCERYPPVPVYQIPPFFSDKYPDGMKADDLSTYFRGTPVSGYGRCGEWKLREGLVLDAAAGEKAPSSFVEDHLKRSASLIAFPFASGAEEKQSSPEPFWARPRGSKLLHAWSTSEKNPELMQAWCNSPAHSHISALYASDQSRKRCLLCSKSIAFSDMAVAKLHAIAKP